MNRVGKEGAGGRGGGVGAVTNHEPFFPSEHESRK